MKNGGAFVGTSSLAEETPETHDRDRTLAQVIEELAIHLQESTAPRPLPWREGWASSRLAHYLTSIRPDPTSTR